jgi:hypothetical protein
MNIPPGGPPPAPQDPVAALEKRVNTLENWRNVWVAVAIGFAAIATFYGIKAWDDIKKQITSQVEKEISPNTQNTIKEINAAYERFKDVDAIVPIGTIMAWHNSIPGTPTLPLNWLECNGQEIRDAKSPFFNRATPNLNGDGQNRFLRGSNVSGEFMDDDTKTIVVSNGGGGGGAIPYHGQMNGDNGYVDGTITVSKNGTSNNGNSTSKPLNTGQFGWNDEGNVIGLTFSLGGGEVKPKSMNVIWIMKIK